MTIEKEPSLVIFYTGGTIGMTLNAEQHGVTPAVNLSELLQGVQAPLPRLNILPVSWSDLPSPHMTPELMFRLGQDVQAALADPAVAGAIVVHGTDVMEETAYMLDLTVDTAKPIICTGAMRYFGEPGYDGHRNIINSILLCLAAPAELGAGILMADRLYCAAEAAKVHSLFADAFDAPGSGPIGYVVGETAHFTRCAPPRRKILTPAIRTDVVLIKLYTGMDDLLLRACLDRGTSGIVLEAFGAGNIPPGIIPAVDEAIGRNIPVVLTTRCQQGGVWPIYAYHGGAAELASKGVIPGHSLTAQKARLKLMAALGLTEDPTAIREMFRA